MKANEIMTGDYFRIAQTGKIIKIVAVDEDSGSVDYFDGDAGGMLTISAEKIEPIPLTAEILKKNGFIKQEYGWLKLNTAHWCININLFNGKERYALSVLGINAQVSLHGYYLHELQHALRLCGIDKEIEL